MARIYQSASSYGLASWMRPQQGGLPIHRVKKIHLATGKFWGGFLMSGLLCCKNIWMWYNKNRKTTAHKVGCRFIVSENPPQWTANYRGGFSMCILLFVLKNERQQCQYKHTKNHKILEGVIYHRHHLHSNGISATPPCNTVVLIIVSCKRIFDKKDKKLPPSQLCCAGR